MAEPMEKTMRMRIYVLKEIMTTERDYVKTLKFLVSVFMERLQNREDDENDKLVPKGSVLLLLSNVEDLYKFHQEMLASIEEALSPEPSYEMKIGQAFLKHREKFEVYAPYCSNHERAQKKLNELTENQEFQGFILGCLLLGNYVNDVSMEGFLLTPIQRICKYPLLLRELMKKTPMDHPDHADVTEALNLMKEVCSNVNETKRQLEQLEKLEDLQATIANWEGANLTDTCTRLIKQGALLKISAGNIQERQFFLFDHLLVYAKKTNTLPRINDTNKTGTIQRNKKIKRKKSVVDQKKSIFKGRISTELMEIENLEDGASDFHCGGYTVSNGWKVLNAAKNKWFVLLAKDKEEKESWLNEFIMERERRKSKVNIDQRDTMDVMHSRGRKIYYKATHQGLIKDRKAKLRTYPKTLLGNNFVEWLVENKEANSVDEAVLLGQALLDCGIIHHVQDKHHFKNEAVLFRFRYDDGTFKQRGESQDLVAKGLRIYCRIHCLFQPIVRDKDRQLRSYKQVIEAKKLIDWLLDQGDCQSREEAINLGQSLCENAILHHALDKQDFKDDSSLFKFFPDEEASEPNKLMDFVRKSTSKTDFKFHEGFKTKTLLLLNVSENEPLGFEAKFIEQQKAVVITAVVRGSQAQIQGLQPGMTIFQINNDVITTCYSQEHLDCVMRHNLEKFKLIFVTIKSDDELTVGIPVTREGMGFQIRGSNPCVVHAVAIGGMAMNQGLVKGHAILKVNGKHVSQDTHDAVAAAIREGCRLLPPDVEKNKEEEEDRERKASISSEDSDKSTSGSNNSLNVSDSGIKKRSSIKRKNLAMMIGINHTSLLTKGKKHSEVVSSSTPKQDNFCLQLQVGNRHLERMCTFSYDNLNGIRNHVMEKMSESPSIFDLSAQLLEVLIAEDERVLADVQALEQIAPFVAVNKSEVFERRRSLRYEVIQERLESYKKYKRHLASYMWPSYKEAREKPSSMVAKDFCPTNCHVNIMQVSHTSEKYNLRGMGLPDTKAETQYNDPVNMVHTSHVMTCLAAPSFRTKGKEGHGLMAVLRGVEGNTEFLDSIRQLMVALDHALLELRQGQCQLIGILNSETRTDGKRNSFQIAPMHSSYQLDDDQEPASEEPATPLTPPTNFYGKNHSGDKGDAETKGKSDSSDSLLDSENNNENILTPMQPSNSNGDDFKQNSSTVNGNKRKSLLDEGSVTGNDSECDSGIHSNRGSMVVQGEDQQNDKQFYFNFSNSSDQTKSDHPPADGRLSTISNSSDHLSTPNDDKRMRGSTSMPSLVSPSNTSTSPNPVNMRAKGGRPHSRVTFSGRDRISLISATESTCSSDGVESLNFIDLVLSNDALDKLQGTMEHFLSKIHSLNELVRSEIVQKVFDNTQETTPKRQYSKTIEALTASTSDDAIKMALSVCEDTEQFADVINTLIEAVDRHVNEVRTQLVLSVLLSEDPKLVSRRDKVFSQSLVTAISAFSTQLRCAIGETFNNMKAYGVRSEEASKKWLEQCMSIGVAIMFITMLNPNMPEEGAMLEDSCIGVHDLERVSFHFRAITGDVEPNECPCNVNNNFSRTSPVHIDVNGIGYSMEGNRCALKVYFHLDKHIFIKLPPRLQAGGGVKLMPVIFNHGLEDLGALLYEQDVSMQEFSNSINEKALAKTYDYYKRFRAFHLDRSKLPRDTEARAILVDRLSRPLNALDEIMTLLEANVKQRHGKPSLAPSGCGVLTLAAEFCRRLGGCHIIACNNGVQRSTTACALEESLILCRSHGLPPKYLTTSSFQLRQFGARVYAFNKNPNTRDKTVKTAPRMFRTDFEAEAVPTLIVT